MRPWTNGSDIVRNRHDKWIIDFGIAMPEATASLYELPFAHVLNHVKPDREKNNREIRRKYWWRFSEAMPAIRAATKPLPGLSSPHEFQNIGYLLGAMQ
ncbi:MAG: hypothetical protein IPI20_08090 [Rhodoferax sp.]|nr:hypothetical protein [Rhodoferax sp.]